MTFVLIRGVVPRLKLRGFEMAYNNKNNNKKRLSGSRIEVARPHEKIMVLYYTDGHEQHEAMGRFQAHYDAPVEKFRAGYFSRGEFVKWTKTYSLWSSPWVGTNKPVDCINRVAGFGDNSPEEQFVIDSAKDMPEGSYLISSTGTNGILRHELLHALFYVDEKYREAVRAIVAKYPEEAEDEFKWLRGIGYADISLVDECNAYICGDGGLPTGTKGMKNELRALASSAIEENGIDMAKLMKIGSAYFMPFYMDEHDDPKLFTAEDDLFEIEIMEDDLFEGGGE